LAVTSSDFQGAPNVTNAILRLPEVSKRTGKSRSTIYLDVSNGKFPAPVKLGARAVGWVESEIEEWLQQLIEASRKAARPVQRLSPTKAEVPRDECSNTSNTGQQLPPKTTRRRTRSRAPAP
jgi:prophage regulatory protein